MGFQLCLERSSGLATGEGMEIMDNVAKGRRLTTIYDDAEGFRASSILVTLFMLWHSRLEIRVLR